MPIKIKGTSFRKENIDSLLSSVVHRARLVHEPDNPYDDCAIEVYIEHKHVGYLPREWRDMPYAKRVLDILSNPENEIDAVVIGGFEMNGVVLNRGISLLID